MRLLFSALTLVLASVSATAATEITDPPALRDPDGYVAHVETALFNGTVSDVRSALQTPDTGVLAFVRTTDRIPAISNMANLEGDFPDVGAIRRLYFEDGSEVVERVIENGDNRFVYQVWGFTSANARALSHIRGEFRYEPTANGPTQVTWTYSIAPRFFLVRPFVRNFLKNDFAPFMASGLQGAASSFNANAAN